MKGFVKFLKNLFWFCVVLALIGVTAGICYVCYDYYSGGAEKYDKLYTQAIFWVTNLKNKITGEETVELKIEEVSPSRTPVMILGLENSDRADMDGNRNCVFYDEEGNPIIFVYGKDIGGDLYFPYGLYAGDRVEKARLFTGNMEDMPDITEFFSWDRTSGFGMISEEFLLGLEPGEYYIFLDPVNEQGDGCGAHYVPLIVEAQTTYISTQQGFSGEIGDLGFIYNDLQNVQQIVLPFYNLGDSRIIMVKELIDGMPGQVMEKDMSTSDYEILPGGNAVVLKEEYLSSFSANDLRRYQVMLSSGKTLDVGYTRFFTIDGEPDWLSLSGPDVYDMSEGGDFVLDISKGWAMGYHCVTIWDISAPPNIRVVEHLTEDYNGDNPFIDEEKNQVVITESFMQSLKADNPYNLVFAYSFPGSGFINYNFGFITVP